MSEFSISKYTKEDTLPQEVSLAIHTIFQENYPTQHSSEDRANDSGRYLGESALASLLGEGRVFYVAFSTEEDTRGGVAGFIEARTKGYEDGSAYELLVWIMAALKFRGQGVASELHTQFEQDAIKRAHKRKPAPTALLLSVHKQNPARHVYERWGYGELRGEDDTDSPDKIFMQKPIE